MVSMKYNKINELESILRKVAWDIIVDATLICESKQSLNKSVDSTLPSF